MNSFIGFRHEHEGGDERTGVAVPTAHPSSVDIDQTDAYGDDEAAADFLQRLSDLDQFVGASDGELSVVGSPIRRNAAATIDTTTITEGFTSDGEFIYAATASAESSADAVDIDELAFGGRDEDIGEDNDEANDFLERLGDLDRFIGATTVDEADDFHQRLSELDRFVSADAAAAPSSLCTTCHRPVDSRAPDTVHAVPLIGAIEGRSLEGLPRLFHATCWVDNDAAHRRTR